MLSSSDSKGREEHKEMSGIDKDERDIYTFSLPIEDYFILPLNVIMYIFLTSILCHLSLLMVHVFEYIVYRL